MQLTPDFESPAPDERVLWEAIDDTIFGTEEIEPQFLEAVDRALAEGKLKDAGSRQSLGQTLKRMRRDYGLTPTEAAAMAGVQASRWRGWEANTRLPSAAELTSACRALELDADSKKTVYRLHRQAPAAQLERCLWSLGAPSKRVARTTGEALPETSPEALLGRLDPALRGALEDWLRSRGLQADASVLARALKEANGMPAAQKKLWVRDVIDFFESRI